MHISVPIKSSRWLRCYLLGLHLLVLSALLQVSSGWPQQCLVLLLTLASLGYTLRRHTSNRSGNGVSRVSFTGQHWLLHIHPGSSGDNGPNADTETQVVLKQVTVWPWLLVMNFYDQHSARRYSVVLLRDSCDKQQWRRLSALLRHWPVFQG